MSGVPRFQYPVRARHTLRGVDPSQRWRVPLAAILQPRQAKSPEVSAVAAGGPRGAPPHGRA